MKNLNEFLIENNIKTNNIQVYYEALTHKSYANEKRIDFDYQRLEFLGDSILDFLVAEFLVINYPDMTEGQMSILKAKAVKGETLANFTKEIGLDKQARLGNSKLDLTANLKIFADMFESFIGAMYLDQGIEKVKDFLSGNIFQVLKKYQKVDNKNPKTTLQEYLQSESRATIKYTSTKNGEIFTAEVYHDGNKFGEGKGKTKKLAEVNAAIQALKLLGKGNDEIN